MAFSKRKEMNNS